MSLLSELAVALSIAESDLRLIVATAPKRYKIYEIPKRRGGTRTIAQPSRELKAIQRHIVDEKLSKMPIHKAAMAYREGVSIADNARRHQNSRILLKVDFSDFFPSIVVRDWRRRLKILRPDNIDLDDLPIYDRVLFWGRGGYRPLCLSIGAPSSPILSNIVMFDVDTFLYARARESAALSIQDMQMILQCPVKIKMRSYGLKSKWKSIFRGLHRRVYSLIGRRGVFI